jgi:hypothetical protein
MDPPFAATAAADTSGPLSPPVCDVLAYPDGLYQYIYHVALVLHPTHIFAAFHYGKPECGVMNLVLYGASLNYWRLPLMGSWRRLFDRIVAKLVIGYTFYLSLSTTNWWVTALPIAVGSSCYFVSIVLDHRGYTGIAAFLHCMIHVLVSFGATMTYRDLSFRQSFCPLNLQ